MVPPGRKQKGQQSEFPGAHITRHHLGGLHLVTHRIEAAHIDIKPTLGSHLIARLQVMMSRQGVFQAGCVNRGRVGCGGGKAADRLCLHRGNRKDEVVDVVRRAGEPPWTHSLLVPNSRKREGRLDCYFITID